MSHLSSIACLDCRKARDLGVGSYATSTRDCKTLEEFDKLVGFPKELSERAANHRAFLVEHSGHKLLDWDSDVAYLDDSGDLRLFYDDDLIEEKIGAFEWAPPVTDDEQS